jgi:IrrE N-terminal-like domain
MADQYAQRLARRRQIPRLVERALKDAGVAGVFPTPLEAVQEHIGIAEVIDISQLPEPVEVKKPAHWKTILGAWLSGEKTIFVDFSQGEERSNFTEAHETAHELIPWHEEAFLLDHEATLFADVKEGLEEEANFGATALIFQNGRFHQHALQHDRTISTPILLAPNYKASYHATIRHYVEGHPEPVALLITGRIKRTHGLPIWTAVESDSFREKYGSIATRFPAGCLDHPESLVDLADESMGIALRPPSCQVKIKDRGGSQRDFTTETFFNQRCVFLMFSPKTRVRTGRRVVAATKR